jgi:uncharacterized SAM-binding protein YcdF (DUF218 family)
VLTDDLHRETSAFAFAVDIVCPAHSRFGLMSRELYQVDKIAIIVLGALNDENGILSSLARERCDQALLEYRQHPGSNIIPTGGWGKHFNTTSQPHGHYLREYLLAHEIPAQAILECAASSNTIEDAKLCRPIVERRGFRKLIVVTSDFHIARARLLFSQEFPDLPIEFSAAKTHLPAQELQERINHEQNAIAKLNETIQSEG